MKFGFRIPGPKKRLRPSQDVLQALVTRITATVVSRLRGPCGAKWISHHLYYDMYTLILSMRRTQGPCQKRERPLRRSVELEVISDTLRRSERRRARMTGALRAMPIQGIGAFSTRQGSAVLRNERTSSVRPVHFHAQLMQQLVRRVEPYEAPPWELQFQDHPDGE